jgi:hypothetical protein
MSSGAAGIECRLVDRADYPSTFELTPLELARVLEWLLKLP